MGVLDAIRGIPSHDRFANMVIAALRRAGFRQPIEYDAKEYRLSFGDPLKESLSLANAYQEYCAAPRRSRRAILQRYVTLISERPPVLPRRFLSRRDVQKYVESELQRVVPAGWKATPSLDGSLRWIIGKTDIKRDEWPDQDYSLLVSDDLDLFVITYGNKDFGPWGLWHVLLQAKVISQSAFADQPLGRFELGECIQDVMAHCKPNEWGYT